MSDAYITAILPVGMGLPAAVWQYNWILVYGYWATTLMEHVCVAAAVLVLVIVAEGAVVVHVVPLSTELVVGVGALVPQVFETTARF